MAPRFVKIFAMVWAGSQVTKLLRAGGYVLADRFLDLFPLGKYESRLTDFSTVAEFGPGLPQTLLKLLLVGLRERLRTRLLPISGQEMYRLNGMFRSVLQGSLAGPAGRPWPRLVHRKRPVPIEDAGKSCALSALLFLFLLPRLGFRKSNEQDLFGFSPTPISAWSTSYDVRQWAPSSVPR